MEFSVGGLRCEQCLRKKAGLLSVAHSEKLSYAGREGTAVTRELEIFFFKSLFIHERHGKTEAETQAEGEASSMQGA